MVLHNSWSSGKYIYIYIKTKGVIDQFLTGEHHLLGFYDDLCKFADYLERHINLLSCLFFDLKRADWDHRTSIATVMGKKNGTAPWHSQPGHQLTVLFEIHRKMCQINHSLIAISGSHLRNLLCRTKSLLGLRGTQLDSIRRSTTNVNDFQLSKNRIFFMITSTHFIDISAI